MDVPMFSMALRDFDSDFRDMDEDEPDQAFEEQERFAENYPSLSWLLDSCISDFSSYNGLFDDAGVLQEMEAVMKNPDAPSAWQMLRDATEAASLLPRQ